MRRAFLLEIAGLGEGLNPVRYYSGSIAPQPKVDGASGHTFADVSGLLAPDAVELHLDPRGGVAKGHGIEIGLVSGRRRPRGRLDPGTLLRRSDFRRAPYARLIESIPSTADAPDHIAIDRDPVVFGPTPLVVHINQEAFLVTGTDGDGSEGDPYRFIGVTRAIWGTLPATHTAQPLAAARPLVLSRVCFWQTRRAVLYEAEIYSDIAMGPVTEVMRGFVDAQPQPGGNSVQLELVPITELVEQRVSTTRVEGGLAQGVHYFDGVTGITIGVALGFEQGMAWYNWPSPGSPANAGEILGEPLGHQRTMDITLPLGHPRQGSIAAGQHEYAPIAYLDPPDRGWSILDGPHEDLDANDALSSAAGNELHLVDVVAPGTAELKAWPQVVLDSLGALRPGTHLGAAGAWADVSLSLQREGYALHAWRNVLSRGPAWLTVWSHDWWPSDFGPRPTALVDGELSGAPPPSRMLTYGMNLNELGDHRAPPAVDAPVDEKLAARWARRLRVGHGSDRDGGYVIEGFAHAYYRAGEAKIASDTFIPVPDGQSVTVKITHTPPGGQESALYAEINDCEDLGGGVYLLSLTERSRRSLPSFGDWPQQPATTIVPTLRMQRQRAPHAILRLLESSGGSGALGQFDTEAFGAEIHEDEIDLQSIAHRGYALDEWSPPLDVGSTVNSVLDPILKANGLALTMVNVDGKSKVRCVSVSDTGRPASYHLESKDWDIRVIPEEEAPPEIVNLLKISMNHADRGAGEAARTIYIEEGGSIAANKGEHILEIDARGLAFAGRAAASAAIRDMTAEIFSRLAYPQPLIRAHTTTKAILRVNPGDVVEVSSGQLPDGDGWGVERIRMLVLGWTRHLAKAGGELVLMPLGSKVQYWAASATVVKATTETTLEVELNADTDMVDPITGDAITDTVGFEVGDKAWLCAPYDYDDKILVQITAVTPNGLSMDRIEPPAAGHGIAFDAGAGALIVPASYLSATDRQREGSYLANDAGRLGSLHGEDGVALVG